MQFAFIKNYYLIAVGLILIVLLAIFFPSRITNQVNFVSNTNLIPPNDRPGTPGITQGGFKCGPGIRQLPWSDYSPICQPVFQGNNLGSTSFGVTAKTITVTFRYALPPQYQTLLGYLKGSSVLGTLQDAVRTLQAYINLFNKSFELYGRKVVLKPFTGKGDLLSEIGGSGLAQAEADAAQAKSLGAFADISLIFSTPVYDQGLARNDIIAITGGFYQSTSWFQSFAPYVYSTSPTCDMAAAAAASIISRSMPNQNAIFANSPLITSQKRKFALLYPSNPQYQECSSMFQKAIEKDGVPLVKVISYSLSLTGATELSASTVEQLKSSGVTTILCACDPISPIILTNQAKSLDYYPEWFTIDWGDSFAQLLDKSEFSNAITGGIPGIVRQDQESYKALLLTGIKPSEINPLYSSIYLPLLMFFDALQAAGPDLTPQTFEEGFWSLPEMHGALTGTWKFKRGSYVAQDSFEVLQYNPNQVSPQDGKKGAYVPCNDGRNYYYDSLRAAFVPGKQLQCPLRGPS